MLPELCEIPFQRVYTDRIILHRYNYFLSSCKRVTTIENLSFGHATWKPLQQSKTSSNTPFKIADLCSKT